MKVPATDFRDPDLFKSGQAARVGRFVAQLAVQGPAPAEQLAVLEQTKRVIVAARDGEDRVLDGRREQGRLGDVGQVEAVETELAVQARAEEVKPALGGDKGRVVCARGD